MDLRKEDRQIERRKCVLHAVNDPEKEIFYLSSYLRHSSATRLVYLAKFVETNSFIKIRGWNDNRLNKEGTNIVFSCRLLFGFIK